MSQHVSPDQIVTAASAGNAEDLALCHPDEYRNPFPDSPGQPNFLTGREQAVWSVPGIYNRLSMKRSQTTTSRTTTPMPSWHSKAAQAKSALDRGETSAERLGGPRRARGNQRAASRVRITR
jgi:hypothetical protein